MKRKRLLFAAMAFIAGALGFNVNAQEAGTYYIQNVETGKWLGPGNNWSTQASVMNHADYWKLASISDGVFTLESVVSNGGTSYYLNGTYCDGGATNFTFAAIAGKENTYSIANANGGYLTTNGTIVDVSATDGSSEASQWKLWSEEDMTAGMNAATVENPFDATYLIKDHDLGRNNRDYTSAWSNTGATAPKTSDRNESGSSRYSVEAYHAIFDVNQTISNVPNGVYAVRVNGFYRQDGSGVLPVLYANDSQTTLPARTGSENNMQQAAVSFEAGNYLSDPAYVKVTDGTLTIGVKTEGNSCWVIFKNFHLYYYGDNVEIAEVKLAGFVNAYQEALAAAQAYQDDDMFDPDKQALNNAINDNTLNLSDPNLTEEELTTATTNLNNAAAAAAKAQVRYATYANIVNAVTGNTNVNITSYVANLGFEDGNLNAWTTADGGNVATNNNFSGKVGSYFVERWRDGAALGAGSLTHDVITLPAGVYTITVNAQNIEQYNSNAAGTGYFFCVNDVQKEIGANATYTIGVKYTETTDVTLKFLLNDCTGNWISCDNIIITYVGEDFPEVTAVEGKMNADVAAAQTAAIETYNNNKNLDNYNAAEEAINAAQASVDAYTSAAAAIAAANALMENHNLATEEAITTFAEAIAAIETPYDENTLTTDAAEAAGITLGVSVSGWRANANAPAVNYMENGFGLTDFEANLYINTWSTEGESDGSDFKVPFYEYWTGDGNSLGTNTWTGTLSDLPNGLYSVSALVRVRAKNGTAAADATGITMDVNGGEAKDVTEGDVVGTSQFQLATYEAEGLVKDGTLNVNFNIAAENNISWLSFKNVKYTKVRDLTPEEEFVAATPEDYAALNAAIDAYVLGFDADEYAPYNNVVGVTALAAAKAIDQEANNAQEDVQAATAAITGATWTANLSEINAVYDGTFAAAENNGAPAGWTMSNNTLGGSLHARVLVDDRLSVFNETNSAFYIRFDGTNSNRGSMYYYGQTDGYTMPLKANTTYYVSADLAGWGQGNKTIRINVGGPEGFSALYQDTKTTVRVDNATNDPIHVKFFFTTSDAGDYRISLQNPGANEDNAAVISNIEIMRAPEVTIDEDKTLAVGKYATRIYPFAPQAIKGVNFYTCDNANGNELVLSVATELAANTPYILGNDNEDASEAISIEQTGYDIHVNDTYTDGWLTGVFAPTTITEGYVLQTQNEKQAFYKVNAEKAITVPAYRAYLNKDSEVKAFNLGDDTTGISALEALTNNAFEAIYSADGVKLNRIEKGVNILKMSDGTTRKVILK